MFEPDFETINTPIASDEVEITAIAESPLNLPFWLSRNKIIAAKITIGIENNIGAALNEAEIAKAPKAICESPSPIIEYLFKTKQTPNKAEQSETSVPTISAFCKKE